MNHCCIKRAKFKSNNNIKVKLEIDGKINLYSHYIDCGFKKFETINIIELSDTLKSLNYTSSTKV